MGVSPIRQYGCKGGCWTSYFRFNVRTPRSVRTPNSLPPGQKGSSVRTARPSISRHQKHDRSSPVTLHSITVTPAAAYLCCAPSFIAQMVPVRAIRFA